MTDTRSEPSAAMPDRARKDAAFPLTGQPSLEQQPAAPTPADPFAAAAEPAASPFTGASPGTQHRPAPPATPPPSPSPAPRGVSRWLRWALAVLTLIALGALLGMWAADRLPWRGAATTPDDAQAQAATAPATLPAATGQERMMMASPGAVTTGRTRATADPATAGPLAAPTVAGAEARIFELERRIARLTAEADVVSGNAARAEALLVAFGARRALDRGLPLGYLAEQLTVRFGDAQPNAVRSVIATGAEPVTLDTLRAGLDAAAPRLQSFAGTRDPLARLRLAVGSMVTARDAGGRSVTVPARLERARRHVDAGRVALAIGEVEAIPGSARTAAAWLAQARRYAESRRALDLIESAAILAPQGQGPVSGLRADQAEPTSGTDEPVRLR